MLLFLHGIREPRQSFDRLPRRPLHSFPRSLPSCEPGRARDRVVMEARHPASVDPGSAKADRAALTGHAVDDVAYAAPGVEPAVEGVELAARRLELKEAERGDEEAAVAIKASLARSASPHVAKVSPSIHWPSMIAHATQAARRRSK